MLRMKSRTTIFLNRIVMAKRCRRMLCFACHFYAVTFDLWWEQTRQRPPASRSESFTSWASRHPDHLFTWLMDSLERQKAISTHRFSVVRAFLFSVMSCPRPRPVDRHESGSRDSPATRRRALLHGNGHSESAGMFGLGDPRPLLAHGLISEAS